MKKTTFPLFCAMGCVLISAAAFAAATPSGDAAMVTKPTAPVVVPVAPPQAVPPAVPPTGTITAGDLTISHARVVYKKDHLDLFLSIKNSSKADEKLGGVDSPAFGSGVVQVTKDKDGKETEAPVAEVLTAEKTVDFSTDGTWLRIKDVKAEPKNTDVIPVALYFRRSPNVTLKIAFNSKDDSEGGGSLLKWFKQ